MVEKELSRDIEDIYDPIPQIDDDWEAMYLDGVRKFSLSNGAIPTNVLQFQNIIDQSCRNGYVDDDVVR